MTQWLSQCGRADLRCGDSLQVMPTLAPDSVDAIVTDPPYGLTFMGKEWDRGVPGVEFWREAIRVAKPGAHLLAFGGTRTFHRLTCAIEDAGWEIRDCVMWVYGSGFPKSLDVSKAIDKAAGAEREVTGQMGKCGMATAAENYEGNEKWSWLRRDTPATDAARKWSGWGTALKPSWEPVIVARKPCEGTVAANVLKYGTGAINVDGCKVGSEILSAQPRGASLNTDFASGGYTQERKGRWPANLIHDGSDEVVDGFPQDGESSAARFFYCAKADGEDRDFGMVGCAAYVAGVGALRDGKRQSEPRRNTHPTVKPNDLMRYLIKLIAPKDALILDPFMGSGSTGVAAIQMHNRFIGIELGPDHFEICKRRVAAAFDTFPLLNPKGDQ